MKPHKHSELIKAWADGAEIECFSNKKKWELTEFPVWNVDVEYRVKPQSEYIPFDISDAEFLIGKVIKRINTNHFVMIYSVSENGINRGLFRDIFQYFTFLDGSICGKLKQ